MLFLLLAFAASALAQQGVIVCPSGGVGTTGPVGFLVDSRIVESPLAYKALIMDSGDGGTWWDKTCGFQYHASCDPPYALLGAVPASIGASVRNLVDIDGATFGAGVFHAWATTLPEDANAQFLRINLVLAAALDAAPWATYARYVFP